MRYCMSLLFAGFVACAEGVPVKDGADAGDDTPVAHQIVDEDGDGYGRPVVVHKDGYIEHLPPRGAQDDCNDGDPSIYPEAPPPDTACEGGYWETPE